MEEVTEKKRKRSFFAVPKAFIKDLFNGNALEDNIGKAELRFALFIMVLILLYINNRFLFTQELIEYDALKKELISTRYNALTRSSELTEKSRQSHVEEYIANKNIPLTTPNYPPFILKKSDYEEK